MSQIYQPVMLKQLLENNGAATVQQIAQAILDKDPTQIEYFSEIVKNMVGRVLTKNRGVTEKEGNTYRLIGSQDLSQEQVNELLSLCEKRIQDFEQHRMRHPAVDDDALLVLDPAKAQQLEQSIAQAEAKAAKASGEAKKAKKKKKRPQQQPARPNGPTRKAAAKKK